MRVSCLPVREEDTVFHHLLKSRMWLSVTVWWLLLCWYHHESEQNSNSHWSLCPTKFKTGRGKADSSDGRNWGFEGWRCYHSSKPLTNDKGLSGNENRFSFHLHLHLMADKFGHTPNWARTMALLLAQPTFYCYISYVWHSSLLSAVTYIHAFQFFF